uniref:Band 3 cytoplasmic domain-containing protein n=2 Tax=Alexandrium monilatum TaxID=311494 RepID=A0A7S4PXY8_9DINO
MAAASPDAAVPPQPSPLGAVSPTDLQTPVLRMFSRRKHLFIELHEFQGASWHETHRWNYGLEEDLVETDGNNAAATERSWTGPHLPSSSLLGMVALRQALDPELVLLDLLDEEDDALEPIAGALLDRLAATGRLAPERRDSAQSVMMQHLQRQESAVVARYSGKFLEQRAAGRRGQRSRVGPSTPASPTATSPSWPRSRIQGDDPLMPEEDEETVHILIDTVDWLDKDAVGFVRLCEPVDTGLEEQASGSKARFIVMVLGPDSPAERDRHIQMGEAAAALLQHDSVVEAAYMAREPREFLAALERCFKEVRLVPQTSHPTLQGVRQRTEKMLRQMADMQRKKDALRTQKHRWRHRQRLHMRGRVSISGTLALMQKLALPLLTGIALALIWVNADPHSYDHWAGYGPGEEGVDHHLERPTVFGLQIKGHGVTLHFLVNDVLMCLFFGLAAKEITEAFQPGGSLYPPARSTVNVLAATVGGVLGPAGVYLAVVSALFSAGVLDSRFTLAEYTNGWGIPTATDIAVAWMAAVFVFGEGHPAIDFLLLLAVIDDGIGLLIIAVAYPDPENPVKPVWLLLVLAGALLSLCLRKLRCDRWLLYVMLAGPLSWLGLFLAGLHPSLALVAVVPFMPLRVEAAPSGVGRLGSDLPADCFTDVNADGSADGQGRCGRAPLHEFEEATKPFVDFVLLFAFGLVNAGVQVSSSGILTAVVLGSLVLGKTLGILGASTAAACLGCPPPAGIGLGAIGAVGFIASAGLTVALFIAGEAFEKHPVLMDQAKLGALLSVLVALVAILAQLLRGGCRRRGEPGPAADEHGEPFMGEDFKESLEEIVVKNTVRSLQMIHRAEKAVEETQASWGFSRR